MFLSPLRALACSSLVRAPTIAYRLPPTTAAAAVRGLHLPARPPTPSSTLLPYISTFRSPFNRSVLPPGKRSFSLSALLRGPRPYYRGGSSNSGYGGGGRGGGGGWKHKIDSLSPNVILYGIIGECSSLSSPPCSLDADLRAPASVATAGLNAGVFLMWQYGQSVLQQFRVNSRPT